MSPTRYDRPANLIVCTGVQAEVGTLETDVEFYTRIETDSSNTTMSDATTAIMWVSGEVIDSLASRICDSTNNNSSRMRDLEGSCILTISTGTPDTRIVSCTPENELSRSCTWYRGSLRLIHEDKCTSNDISAQVINTLRNITTADFSEAINMGVVKVTDVEFTDAPSLDKEITDMSVESSRNRLTSGGASITVILALTLIALVVLLVGIRRVRKYRLEKVSFDDSAIRNKKSKSCSHIEPNWRDIGARHSGMDCRHCNSLMCTDCSNEKNKVRMLKFDRNVLYDMSVAKEITKVEKNSNLFDKRRQPKRTRSREIESDGIRIDENENHCPSNDVGVDTQQKNIHKSILL